MVKGKKKAGKEKRVRSPISAEDFKKYSQPLMLTMAGQNIIVPPRANGFSTGSQGWYVNQKSVVMVNEVGLPVQVQVTVTVIGSKPGQDDEAEETEAE